MRHAFLITAYTDFDFLKKTIEIYTSDVRVDCYIHVDKKVKMPKDLEEWTQKHDRVYLYSRYKINWGSYKHISAVLLLMKEALRKGSYDYFHIISANSFITRNISEVLDFFEQGEMNTNYVQVVDLEEDDKDKVIDPWFIYYHFLHIYDKRTEKGYAFDKFLEKVQRKLGIRRKTRYKYKGLLYAHYTREFIEYALEYVKAHPRYFWNLKMCNISEEFFFQNILMYSPFKDKIYNSHLLYDVWNSGGIAQFLTESDFEKIKSGEYLFARKFGQGSEKLFEMICKEGGMI